MSATLVQKSTSTTKFDNETNADIRRLQQLATYSLMLEYDIDNTLNTFKETHSRIRQQQHQQQEQIQQTTMGEKHAEQQHEKKEMSDNEKDMMQVKRPTPSNTTLKTASGFAIDGNSSVMEPITIDTQSPEVDEFGEAKSVMPPTPPVTPNLQQNTAQKRWRILAKVLRKDSEETVSSSSDEFSDEQSASVRRFKSFDLLRQDSFEDHTSLKCLGSTENWYKYRMLLGEGAQECEYSVNIHHMERQLTASDLMGFNNTGNICVWPSEEALTALVLADLESYRGKWILELGGGFTSLAGLMLAKYAKPYAVHLTDGNEVSVENVRKTVCLNELSCYTKCSVLKWQDFSARVPAEHSKFDKILCADCLFFDEARTALVETIWYYLSANGVALIMAPRRGKTLNLFREECLAKGFAVDVAVRYNETIWQRHLKLKKESDLYVEDLHYPLLLRLVKLGGGR